MSVVLLTTIAPRKMGSLLRLYSLLMLLKLRFPRSLLHRPLAKFKNPADDKAASRQLPKTLPEHSNSCQPTSSLKKALLTCLRFRPILYNIMAWIFLTPTTPTAPTRTWPHHTPRDRQMDLAVALRSLPLLQCCRVVEVLAAVEKLARNRQPLLSPMSPHCINTNPTLGMAHLTRHRHFRHFHLLR